MEGNRSPNQSEGNLQDVGTNQSQLPGDITDLLEGSTSKEHIIAEESETETQVLEQIIRTNHHTNHERAPILTIEAFNNIFQGGKNKSPILIHETDQEFFRIKEQPYTQNMEEFDNGNGNYMTSRPVALSLALALES